MRSIAASAIFIFSVALAGCSNTGGMVPYQAQSLSRSVQPAGGSLLWAEINYGNPQSQNQIAEFDPATHNILRTFDLNFGGPPLLAGPYFERVYVPQIDGTNVNGIAIVNTQSGSVAQISLPAAENISVLAISPYGHFLYAGTQDATFKIDPNSRHIVARSAVGLSSNSGGHAAAVSPDGTRLYNADGSGIKVLDTATLALLGEYPAGSNPSDVAVSADGSKLYVLGYPSGNSTTLSVVDASTFTTLQTITLSNFPSDMVADASLGRVYVATYGHKIAVVDTTQGKVVHTISLGSTANGLAVDPVTHNLWFVNGNGAVKADPNTFSLATYGKPPLNDAAALALTN